MKRSGITAATMGGALALLVPWALASCATTEELGPPSSDPPPLHVDAGAELDAADAEAPDDECDASDEDCVTTPVTCAEAHFCAIPTNVSRYYVLTSVWGSGKDDVWATGSGGTVIHWDGVEWTPTPLPSGTQPIKDTFHALWGTGPNDVWIASATDMIFHSDGFKNGTATWELTPSATFSDFDRTPLLAAWGTTPDDIRFGGGSSYWGVDDVYFANQVVRVPSESGVEWTRKGTVMLETVKGFWGPSADELWVIAQGSPQVAMTLHGSRTSGEDFVWTEVDSRAVAPLRGIWGSSANDVWVVGNRGTIRHYGPNATEWEIIESPTKANLNAVWGSGPNDVWVVGDSGTILHWDGAAWSEPLATFEANRRKPNLYGIWGSGPDDIWIVGDDIALHHAPRPTGGTK